MNERKDWIIIDIFSRKAIYGNKEKTMMFTSEDIAEEIASQLFDNHDKYIVVNVAQHLKLSIHKNQTT